MPTTLFEFAVLSFISLITMLNPIGILPVFVSMTSDLSDNQSKKVAVRGSLVALITLILFAVSGKLLFDLFSISIDSLRIVGGMIFFIVGHDMFNAKISKMKHDDDFEGEQIDEQAITPIGIPLICGPGSITMVMLLMKESSGLPSKTILFTMIFLTVGITMLILVSSKKILSILGKTGKKVLMRIMGLIVMVVAVDLFFNGLKPILKDIFCG